MVSRLAPTPKPPRKFKAKHVMTGLTLAGQMPVLEHVRNGHEGKVWRVWLSYDDHYENGVYLQLGKNGDIYRYVVTDKTVRRGECIKEGD